jgi:uncharacterized protein RhaS with RHS repeats
LRCRRFREVNPDGFETAFEYDSAGRAAKVGERRYRYDGAGRIAEVFDGDRTSVTYFFYDGAKLTAEADGDGKITKQYVYVEDRPAAVL